MYCRNYRKSNVPVRLVSSEGVTIHKGTRVGQSNAVKESNAVLIADISGNNPAPERDTSVV